MMGIEVVNVFEIDKKKFGSFLAELRKENGLTQKELAKRLFLSDKAVSKWETGVSLPDTALLIPLAEVFGISVTELLMCEKMAQSEPLKADRVEDIVKAAITYADEKPERAYQEKSRWPVFYGASLFMGCAGTFLNHMTKQPCLEALTTIIFLCAVFGAYFCCFVKTRLPTFYDENDVSVFWDGVFEMHMPGMKLNNRNWPYIVKTIRVCMCLLMILFPILNFAIGSAARNMGTAVGSDIIFFAFLVAFLCGFFVPIYLVGKKYES